MACSKREFRRKTPTTRQNPIPRSSPSWLASKGPIVHPVLGCTDDAVHNAGSSVLSASVQYEVIMIRIGLREVL